MLKKINSFINYLWGASLVRLSEDCIQTDKSELERDL